MNNIDKPFINIDTVVTHSGPFHADDLVAIALLQEAASGSLSVVRSRDREALALAKGDANTALVDVGGEYDPERGLLDHHFVGSPLRPWNNKPYASAGMVYEYLHYPKDHWMSEVVEKIDLVDNGTKVEGWTLSLTLHKCNPVTNSNFDERFEKLTILIENAIMASMNSKEFIDMIENHDQVQDWVGEYDEAQRQSEARVRRVMKEAGDLLILNQFEPALVNVVHETKSETLFSIYPSPTDGYMVQQIPVEANSFDGRLSLPAIWAGKRDEELSQLTGVPGCIFVHPGRFIGGNKTLEGAIEMAKKAIEIAGRQNQLLGIFAKEGY